MNWTGADRAYLYFSGHSVDKNRINANNLLGTAYRRYNLRKSRTVDETPATNNPATTIRREPSSSISISGASFISDPNNRDSSSNHTSKEKDKNSESSVSGQEKRRTNRSDEDDSRGDNTNQGNESKTNTDGGDLGVPGSNQDQGKSIVNDTEEKKTEENKRSESNITNKRERESTVDKDDKEQLRAVKKVRFEEETSTSSS
jgi:hypothetical protein